MTTPLFTHRIRPIVVETLRHARIVLISGARQVGKTTLSTEIAPHGSWAKSQTNMGTICGTMI
jgi:predicted AAA+ superfamily ATPase